jgi:crossover junction endodeoxyribonuclease RuvC
MSNRVKVLGIDTGIAIAGWAIVDKASGTSTKDNLIDCGVVITESKDDPGKRLGVIFEGILQVIENYKPDVVAVESLFYFKNQKTVMSVSQARGVILLAAEKAGLKVYDYTPLQVKTAVTGYGRADKKQVQKMVKLIYGLAEVPKPDDAADAVAVATCHLHTNHNKIF